MTQIPLLFLGDSPSLSTGLGRIGRDLALLAARLPQFRVAYLGRGNGAHSGGGIADSRLPFMQYSYQPTAEDQWGTRVLPDVWQNWSRGERGVIFTIWDPSRLTWFGDPRPMGEEYDDLYQFLITGNFDRWGYFAVDAEGPGEGGALAPILAETVAGYERVLAYSQFGKRVLAASLGSIGALGRTAEWLPHGYNGAVFQPRDRTEARNRFAGLAGSDLLGTRKLIGCVMSNQPRKDFGLWARMMSIVRREIPDLLLWVHTDSLTRHWDLRILLDTFKLGDITIVTTDQPGDEEMSWRYSACDLTVLPSLGEGFGYPIVESLACGVPVIHGNYAAGRELIPDIGIWMLVAPTVYSMLDTRYCMMRPVFSPEAWAMTITNNLLYGPSSTQLPNELCMDFVAHLEWRNLAPLWERWLIEGAERMHRG